MFSSFACISLHVLQQFSRERWGLHQLSGFSVVVVIVALFVRNVCPRGGGGMWGIFGKPLKKAIWKTLGVHAVLMTCLKLSSVSDRVGVACFLFLSTGSYHVRIQIHSTGCCFPQCTTETFGALKSALWRCKVGADEPR